MLVDRRTECRHLDELLDTVRNGTSRSVLIRGDVGIGKSALLEYLVAEASGCRVVRVAGVQAESELAFAGLHQLCAPLLDRLDRIPVPQHDALGTAFGLRAGPAPDRFLVGLAVLSLLAAAAAESPLICVVDDAQWLDRISAESLTFVGRRLVAESVGLVFASRDPVDEQMFAGLPQLVLDGLPPDDARELLAAVIPGALDEQVRDRIVAETRGNPLALIELPQEVSYAQLAGGFGLLDAKSLTGRIEDSFRRRLTPLSPDLRRLLLVAAIEPMGQPALVLRAAKRLGIAADTMDPPEFAGLLRTGERITFRHPLVRSAIYREATPEERRESHRALAEVTDPAGDADRRVWHLAHAASGPDEDVAAELERSAGRAGARGGLAAAAAFLERAARLTVDPVRRSARALDAAQAKLQAGAFQAAVDLLAMAESGPLSDLEQARVDLMRAQLAFVTSRGKDAPPLLLKAAKRLEPIDVELCRATYLDGLTAAMFVGALASPGGGTMDVARAAGAAPRPLHRSRAPDLLLDGLAANFNDGYAAAAPMLRQALAVFGSDMSPDEELRWLWLGTEAALHLWDDEAWHTLSARYVELARAGGALSELPLALSTHAYMLLFAGDLAAARSLVDEGHAVTEATGSSLAPYSAMALAALSGQQGEASALIETTIREVTRRGEGIGIAVAHWTNAVLNNGLANYPEAATAAEEALRHQEYPGLRYPGVANWAVTELIEAAVRSGRHETAAEAFDWIATMTGASRTEWALGLEARCRALLTEGEGAEKLYQEAIARLRRTRVRGELARATLLYGEWLRRRGRRVDARDQLRMAHEMFSSMGAEAFAERARHELVSTGEKARKRTVATSSQLTERETQVTRLARDGLSNPEISTRLFLSPRTVEYHLGNVFAKLGIRSRHELSRWPEDLR
ncbi:regulatory LuxR family protein [Kribbella sp. VKM Ac-2571]|uniref:ATP-binding protein n=1 Tax=Kribbella sp. VKM Ac-2571 TaxID=2512222 RepID=UPI00105E0718|nr:helix-turn-helix transcriptional regulator [Kribbella sp. VKM Ac-2571]TDO44821.1 regulatory LuxR family protein [Kribbella sp. VKM Ac-2571]